MLANRFRNTTEEKHHDKGSKNENNTKFMSKYMKYMEHEICNHTINN